MKIYNSFYELAKDAPEDSDFIVFYIRETSKIPMRKIKLIAYRESNIINYEKIIRYLTCGWYE